MTSLIPPPPSPSVNLDGQEKQSLITQIIDKEYVFDKNLNKNKAETVFVDILLV